LVLLRRRVLQTRINKKFVNLWEGPYVIIKIKPPVNAIIKLTAHSREKFVHFNDLKHYISQQIYDEKNGYPAIETEIRSPNHDSENEVESEPDVESEMPKTKEKGPTKRLYPELPEQDFSEPESTQEPEPTGTKPKTKSKVRTTATTTTKFRKSVDTKLETKKKLREQGRPTPKQRPDTVFSEMTRPWSLRSKGTVKDESLPRLPPEYRYGQKKQAKSKETTLPKPSAPPEEPEPELGPTDTSKPTRDPDEEEEMEQ
jgi:hypothetical protein